MHPASPELNNAVIITDIAYIRALGEALANNSYGPGKSVHPKSHFGTYLVAPSIEIYGTGPLFHLVLSVRFALALFLNRQ